MGTPKRVPLIFGKPPCKDMDMAFRVADRLRQEVTSFSQVSPWPPMPRSSCRLYSDNGKEKGNYNIVVVYVLGVIAGNKGTYYRNSLPLQ